MDDDKIAELAAVLRRARVVPVLRVADAEADGVLLDTDGGQRLVPAVPAPLVVDQTGAGDVFAGTLAGHIALGDMPDDTVQLAVAAASLSIGGQGGTGLIPDIARTRAHLAANTALSTPSAV